MSITRQQDIECFVSEFAHVQDLSKRTFLITGGTGLIGSTLILSLLAMNNDIRIIAPIRNKKKAECLFEDNYSKVEWVECELESFDYKTIGEVDYIIHCAAPTSSKFFVDNPVETIDIIYRGTSALLDYARTHAIKGFVYLSSLEVYGSELQSSVITEDVQGYWDPLSVRSSYPIAKRCVENLCVAYASEYNVPVRITRLTQTTGAGIDKADDRIFAQFVKKAVKGEDIVLNSKGESARPYCYTMDAVSAILQILLFGKNGEAYNVANEETYVSAYELAVFVRDHVNPNISVRFDIKDTKKFPPISKLFLSTERLRSLGWNPRYTLTDICDRMKEYLKE